MAKNVEIKSLPKLYQEDVRKAEDVTIDQLTGIGEAFEGYTPQLGDVYRFPTLENMRFKSQPVRAGSNGKVYFVSAQLTRNGKTFDTWFNLNFLNKRDANQVPVNPTWYGLGDMKARVEALAKVGEIRATGTVDINVPVFDRAANRNKVVPTIDKQTGLQMIDEYGTAMTHVETRKQTCTVITPYAE